MGPYDSAKAFEILNNKLDAKLISPDSFVTDGKNYGEKVWTAGSFDMADLENFLIMAAPNMIKIIPLT